ncbi:MAG: alpha/beta hydrolase [Actinomycetota bacterium]|nr:alpha/beta hydrolase [Actinomycetota bacterium]
MRPTISELREWRPDAVTAAGAAAHAASDIVDRATRQVIRAVDATHWTGTTAVWAHHYADDTGVRAARLRRLLVQVADEAENAGADLAHAREIVLAEVDAAIADGYAVTDDGHVTSSDGPDERSRTAEVRIRQGLSVIEAVDEQRGARIDQLVAAMSAGGGGVGVTLPDGSSADAGRVVTALTRMTPSTRREFLSQLTAGDRRQIAVADPHVVGNLDGVDFELRATANDLAIRAALDAERRAGRGDDRRARRLAELLRPRADGTRRRFIAFGNTAQGHVIEMVGVLDAGTRNAAVLVPGTGAGLDTIDQSVAAATELARATDGPVFVYLDGDLPQTMGYEGFDDALGAGAALGSLAGPLGQALGTAGAAAASLDDSAADPRFAREMAPGLVGFAAELDAEIAAHAPGAALTVIGHSYGGSVVGSAEQVGLRADRVVYASSAGTGVFDGPWRNPNAGVERYSLTAPGDPIQYVQSLPGNPHGDDPDTAPGVLRMDTGFYAPGADGSRTPVAGTDGHSDYWRDPGSDAFGNIVRVIVGEQPSGYVARTPDFPLRIPWP